MITLVLDNIRSAFNVGSIFRTADGRGDCRLFLCGYTPTPENPKVKKTALFAEETVPWQYFKTASDALSQLEKDGTRIICLELTKSATDFRKYPYPKDIAIVVGNELDGVDKSLTQKYPSIKIPMNGRKESLNVAIAASIVMYAIPNE
ncbi:RNA methyltransferase [Candidatus Dojkabacteria bacterium]|nr:RNA methyltransferase [Candidatus Dojkabacteria bacterium]